MPPYVTGMAELDAQNYHANEDRKARITQAELDRTAANRKATWDRVVQTATALISAVGAIVAAVIVGLIGIERLSHDAARYTLVPLKSATGPDTALKIDTKTGQAWVLTLSPKGPSWRLVSL
jgi:hypothetical protein